MSELLDYVEKAGQENLKFRLQNAETLAKEASSTLTILLAGIAASMAYAIKGFEQPPLTYLTLGAAGLALWLMIVATTIVFFCMLTTNLEVPTNEPSNLLNKKYELDLIREAELKNLQQRIELTKARNHRVAAWLDRSRLMAISSPIVFLLATLLVWVVR